MSDELVPGMLVGNYRLLFRLGKGGMGEVWAAANRNTELGFQKLIALKVLRTQALTSNAAVMFLDEARAASVLVHAAIVPTVDLGQDGDILFLAMDMVRGPSLTALLQRLVLNKGQMSPAIVAHIGLQLANALDYAHQRATFQGKRLELIHRDVSPHNVLLDLHGAVRLTDFGVARTAIQNHESHVGTVRGKPSYMAPEQVVGGDIDARTDLFSLGIVLYESASLKRLFGRSNPVKSMDAVLKHQPKPLTQLVPGFPPALGAVIEQALAKDPERRWQHAAELAGALSEASRALPGAASAQRDLVALIADTFPPDAFEIDSRVREALTAAGAVEATTLAPRDRARDEAGDRGEPARAARPRGRSRAEAPTASYVADAYGTQAAWPTASAPDPLSPEALEEARTRYAVGPGAGPAGMTPSGGIAAMNMTFMPTAPSADAIPAYAATNLAYPVPSARPKLGLVLGALVAAALVLLGSAFLVLRRRDVPAEAALDAPEPTTSIPGVVAKQSPAAAQKPSPTAVAERSPVAPPGEETPAAPEPAREAERPPRRAAAAGAGTSVKRAGSGPETSADVKAPVVAEAAPATEGHATRAEVLGLIRQVKQVDAEAAKAMYPTLNEAGDDNVKVLDELRARARAILANPGR